MVLGADNLGLEGFPSPSAENFAPVHSYLLAEKGICFIELLWSCRWCGAAPELLGYHDSEWGSRSAMTIACSRN